jgi:hypothetical protein
LPPCRLPPSHKRISLTPRTATDAGAAASG